MLVGVDIGGTFTDLVRQEGNQLSIHKRLSTPDDPARAMLAGLKALAAGDLDAITQVAHGTTVATNAILERRGAKVALLTTEGYRDVLYIGRQDRPLLYALHPTMSPPLVPRELCFDVPERLIPDGGVARSLDMTVLDQILDTLQREQVEAVAVCLLYSYANPIHERAIRDAILARGMLDHTQIALSHEILPEFREYERASTVTLEAYVRPVMSQYLNNLARQLPEKTGLRVMKSDGGVVSANRATEQAVLTALSGPAAGVIGAHHLAMLAGFPNIITLDMGGTSTDVALVPGEPVRRPESEIDGLPLRIRLLDIDTVGAGGGSIARIDAGGVLKVGPQSAGASPGPVAYGLGGTQVTVTDANVVLGRLDAAHFLGGDMSLDMAAAQADVAELAAQMNRSPEQAAQGILDVANVNIDRALRRVSVARGHDPRDFTLVAFGGAGPLHACEVAERLDMRRVLVPPSPGVLCAFGLLMADVVLEYAQSVMGVVDTHMASELRTALKKLTYHADQDLSSEGIPPEQRTLTVTLDARYQGQGYELVIPLTDDIATTFHDAHTRQYGHALKDRSVEVVNLRLIATGQIERPAITPQEERTGGAGRAHLQTRTDGVALYERKKLGAHAEFEGPALVFQPDSTVYLAAGWHAVVDNYGNIILER